MKRIVFIFLFLTAAFSLQAQSSEKISEFLNTEKLSFGQAAYLAAVYTGMIQEDESEEQAFYILQKNAFFSKKDSAEKPITLSSASLLYTKATGMKGGILYTLTKSKRYAFKELKLKGILPDNTDPSMTVSGRDAIAILNGCAKLTEEK